MSFKKLRKEFKLTAIEIASEQDLKSRLLPIKVRIAPTCGAIGKKNRPLSVTTTTTREIRTAKSNFSYSILICSSFGFVFCFLLKVISNIPFL